MIIYQAPKAQFPQQAWRHDVDEIVGRHFAAATGHGVGPGGREAGRNSLVEMARVLNDDEIPADAGVAIEYQLPQMSKRMDVLIAGAGVDGESTGRDPGYGVITILPWVTSLTALS
jgi:hypothetical protein